MKTMLKLQKIMVVPTLHIWFENQTLNEMTQKKKAKFYRSAVGYDHKTNELIQELTTGNLNKTTVECRCKLTGMDKAHFSRVIECTQSKCRKERRMSNAKTGTRI